MNESSNARVPPDLVYGSIRQEILDQKKCQFQLFSMAVTVTAAILAYGAATQVGAVLYVAPMVLNLLALIIIIDKAISIQRKVGYLQMMEQGFCQRSWRWESHLDAFRSLRNVEWRASPEESRKHSYVTTIASMLAILNLLCAGLCWWGSASSTASRQIGWLDAVVLILLIVGPYWGFRKRDSLVRGENSSAASSAKWARVLEKDNVQNSDEDSC